MKTTHIQFVIALLFYIVPVLLFGNPYTITNFTLFLLGTFSIGFLMNYKATEGKDCPSYLCSFLHGLSLSLLGLPLLGIEVDNPLISITANLQSIPTIISMIGFSLFLNLFRSRKKIEYLRQFENDSLALERDKKINKIIDNWY